MKLASGVLDGGPNLLGGRGGTLSTNKRVDTGAEVRHGVLNVAALGESCTQESGIKTEQDPRAALEHNGGEKNANPQEDLQARDNGHGSIVVLLDESANFVSQWAASTLGRGAVGTGRRRLNDGDQVGAGVCRDVEDGVDAVREQSERVLRREEPDKGHDCVGWLVSNDAFAAAFAFCRSCSRDWALTEILDVLIGEKANGTTRHLIASLRTSPLGFVDDNAVRNGSRKERGAVGELGHAAVVVHTQPRESISNSSEN